jgi:hypothetical protein
MICVGRDPGQNIGVDRALVDTSFWLKGRRKEQNHGRSNTVCLLNGYVIVARGHLTAPHDALVLGLSVWIDKTLL